MSSFTRNIQRATARGKNYMGRGSKLGVHDAKAVDLTARTVREDKRNALAGYGK